MVVKTYESPRFVAVLDGETNTWNVEDIASQSTLFIDIPTIQAAMALATLCCLGHIEMNASNEFVVNTTGSEELETLLDLEYEDEEEELNADDGPEIIETGEESETPCMKRGVG